MVAPPENQNAVSGGEPKRGSFDEHADGRLKSNLTASGDEEMRSEERPDLWVKDFEECQQHAGAGPNAAETGEPDSKPGPARQPESDHSARTVSLDEKRARLTRRRGWVKVTKADIALLNENLGQAAPTAVAVWLALLILANDRNADSFQIEINVIRSIAGPCVRTTRSVLHKLEKLGFVRIDEHHVPGTRENEPNTYTLLRSCNDYPTSSGKVCTTMSGNGFTTGPANDEPQHLQGNSKASAKACHKSKRVSARPSSAGAEAERAAQYFHPQPRTF